MRLHELTVPVDKCAMKRGTGHPWMQSEGCTAGGSREVQSQAYKQPLWENAEH